MGRGRKQNRRVGIDFNKIVSTSFTFMTSLMLVACMSQNEEGVSTEGHATFNRVANQEVEFALSGKIKKKPGFKSNCSVDKDTDGGILITRGVCDIDNSFTIRGTNTSNYPHSKRLKFLSLHFGNTKMKLRPGEIKQIIAPKKHKITIELSRTGTSFYIEGIRSRSTPP